MTTGEALVQLGMLIFGLLWIRESYKRGLAELELAAFKCGVRLRDEMHARKESSTVADTGKGEKD